jgi:CheY-specific phosphatase CheX
MNFNPDELISLTATIWEAILRLPIAPETGGAVGNRPRSAAACIQITGAWNGAILLDCPDDFARRAASIMFGKALSAVTVADLQDAIAELVNMIGGNFKALLPEVCFLSLPSVVEGGDYSTRVPGSSLLGRVAFLCEGQSLSIVVLEKMRERAAA